ALAVPAVDRDCPGPAPSAGACSVALTVLPQVKPSNGPAIRERARSPGNRPTIRQGQPGAGPAIRMSRPGGRRRAVVSAPAPCGPAPGPGQNPRAARGSLL